MKGGLGRVRAACALGRRILLLLPLAAPAGCTSTAISARVTEGFSLEQMRAEGKSMVLFHTSLHHNRCSGITMAVAHPDGKGRWVRTNDATVKGLFDIDAQPSQMILPPGEYEIVHLTCERGRQHHHYVSRVAERASILTMSGSIYDRPFATFKVGEGEVVDIGSLAIATGRARDADGRERSVFAGIVAPIPERFLRTLEAKNPTLYNARVARPMVAEPLPPGARLQGAPPS